MRIATTTILFLLTMTACEDPAPDRLFYLNNDGDAYGDEIVYLSSDPFEQRPDNYSPFGGDCDDGNDKVHPDADEVCDGIDNDCDGEIDVDALDAVRWYADTDGDGYGSADWGPLQCVQPAGHVDNGDDCDDGDASAHPGAGCL